MTRLDDPHAVYLDAPEFAAHADGSADASGALQAAIDKAEGHHREGIVFVPEGRYRLDHTVYIWPGVRVIGFGAKRPVFLLAPSTPGFQSGMGVMVMFTGFRPGDCFSQLPRAVSAGGAGSAQRQDCRRQPQHVLFGD